MAVRLGEIYQIILTYQIFWSHQKPRLCSRTLLKSLQKFLVFFQISLNNDCDDNDDKIK